MRLRPASLRNPQARSGGIWITTGWQASLRGDQVSAVEVDDRGPDPAPAYVVADADVGYGMTLPLGQWRTFARIDNLFNRKYAGSMIVNDASGRCFEAAPERTLMPAARWLWTLCAATDESPADVRPGVDRP